MDELDNRLIALLRFEGRMSISKLAMHLNVQRTTVRARMDRLEASGVIKGYSAITAADAGKMPVRGFMMLEIAGRGAEKVSTALRKIPEVTAVHSTNGTWDLIAEIGAQTLEEFDATLTHIRRMDAISRSETSLLLSTKR